MLVMPMARKVFLMLNSPIFIIGVPRSGTTLLRVLLDSHPNIACGPEAPWLARGAKSIKQLYRFMAEDTFGFIKNFDVPPEELQITFANFIDEIFLLYAKTKGKTRWAEKTPDHALEIPFISKLFPEAKFIHIVRDVRDVVCSTAILSDERKAISDWHSKNILMEDGVVVKNTIENAAIRWQSWNKKIELSLKDVQYSMTIHYEEIVSNPEKILPSLMAFLGEGYSPKMLEFDKFHHELPEWEWGSRDINRTKCISSRSIKRWEKQLTPKQVTEIERSVGRMMAYYGYELTTNAGIEHRAYPKKYSLASVEELRSLKFRLFMFRMNCFAKRHGLRRFNNWSKVWEYPWLWYNSLSLIDWKGVKLLDLGSEMSPMPWYLASLGAEVTLVECDEQWIQNWTRLQQQTGLTVDWRIVSDEELPFSDESYDFVTSFSVIEHQRNKKRAISEVIRILKPKGFFALSFDICESRMGMTFPDWNGAALTLDEFETLIWSNESFEGETPLEWKLDGIADFVKWHLKSADHHNYTVGAAILRKKS